MSEQSYPKPGDDGGLGALLVSLDGAAESFRNVEVTYRTWRHNQRLREAFRSHHAELRRRGGASNMVFAAASRGGDPGPVETEETIRIWREGQRVRQEHHGGWRDGSYGVVDGPRWWSWSEKRGATSNRDDTSVGGGIDRGFEVMLDPASLVGSLDLRVAGNSRVASRATITADATPRHESLGGVRVSRGPDAGRVLHVLGTGADSYRLEVDQQRGVLLASTAIHNEQPFYQITTLAIRFDGPIPAETFQFSAPEGEQIRSPLEHFPRPQVVSVTEAARRGAFTVLVPDRMPGWQQLPCGWIDATPRLPSQAVFTFRSDDRRRQEFSIWQMAAADASQHHGNMMNHENWRELLRDGMPIKIRPGDELLPNQVYLTRNGTYAHLSSHSLTTDELVTIAAGLRPASQTDSI